MENILECFDSKTGNSCLFTHPWDKYSDVLLHFLAIFVVKYRPCTLPVLRSDLLVGELWQTTSSFYTMCIFTVNSERSATSSYASSRISTLHTCHFLTSTYCSTSLLSTLFRGTDGVDIHTHLLATSALWSSRRGP